MSKAETYIQPLLKKRALQHILSTAGMSQEDVLKMEPEQQMKLMHTRDKIAEEMQFNTLKWFKPFEYQKEFFKTGLTHSRRGMIAANRAGKTIATCYETAMHLTGIYPKDWEGRTYDHPIIAMCSGESWQQVAKALQAKLLGCDDIKQKYKLGTGAIPLDNILEDTIRSEGPNVLSVEIQHISGGVSKLYFANYTQEVRNLQGFELDLVCLDEQPPDDTFSELVVRTAARRGMVLCSFTPLKGMNSLVAKFWEHVEGYTHVRVTWNDVPYENEWGEPFFTKEEREQMARDFLPYERECRMNGIPMQGRGVVFPMLDWPTYSNTDLDTTRDDLERLISADLGQSHDPTVLSFLFRDPKDDCIYLNHQVTLKNGETPYEWVQYLMTQHTLGIPIALPHDAGQAGRYTLTEQSVREVLEDEYRLNVIPEVILNPRDAHGKITNHKSFGVNEIRNRMERGKFRIHEGCKQFLIEARNYHIDERGKFSDPDDHIDSARYGVLALIQGYGEATQYTGGSRKFLRHRVKPIEGKRQLI